VLAILVQQAEQQLGVDTAQLQLQQQNHHPTSYPLPLPPSIARNRHIRQSMPSPVMPV